MKQKWNKHEALEKPRWSQGEGQVRPSWGLHKAEVSQGETLVRERRKPQPYYGECKWHHEEDKAVRLWWSYCRVVMTPRCWKEMMETSFKRSKDWWKWDQDETNVKLKKGSGGRGEGESQTEVKRRRDQPEMKVRKARPSWQKGKAELLHLWGQNKAKSYVRVMRPGWSWVRLRLDPHEAKTK